MNRPKKHIGYNTPISNLQDEFEENIKSIDLKTSEWKETHKKVSKYLNDQIKESKKAMEQRKPEKLIAFQASVIMFWNLYQIIATLGIHISEVEERLVEIESKIAELKTRFTKS